MIRRYWTIVLLLIGVSALFGQDYYWYKNEKIFLKPGDKFYIIYEDEPQNATNGITIIRVDTTKNGKLIKRGFISNNQIENVKHVLYKTSSFRMGHDTTNVFVSENFYVQLNTDDDTTCLAYYAEKYHAEVIRKGAFSRWYILKCTPQAHYNALELANIFYESQLFSATEPEFLNSIHKTCVNDTYFNQQWNLLNTGQYDDSYTGVDINLCGVRTITTGNSSIIIAVVDGGIKLTHPDLNVYPISYDAQTSTSPSIIYDNHGTSCAGVIGALGNNSFGVCGIAPDCPLMSISWGENTTAEQIANGIKFAIQNGASVINNSWRAYLSPYISLAIDSALYYGREGKGCVVVCSVGNDNMEYTRYPASYTPNIIAVGAITPSAERKDTWDQYQEPNIEAWGSNYGKEMDVVAPGIYIPTTDTTGLYRMDFWGTSAACPHVAAVAGLILSVNPSLTQKEVGYIINATAQKIGTYSYVDTITHSDASWNKHVGHGLVDAHAAVQMALNGYIQDTTYGNVAAVVEVPRSIYAGYHVTNFKAQGDVLLPSGSDMHYIAGNSIHLEPGFRVERGAHFYAEIGNVTYPNTMPERRIELDNEYNRITNREQGSRIKQTYVPNTPFATKFLRDGQLIIKSGDNLFNAEGLRIK